jgi:hypothetical protein
MTFNGLPAALDGIGENRAPAERVTECGRTTQKFQCHARESGHPDLAARAAALDSRLRGNDTGRVALVQS